MMPKEENIEILLTGSVYSSRKMKYNYGRLMNEVKITLWFCSGMNKWRFVLNYDVGSDRKQLSGSHDHLDDATQEIHNIVVKIHEENNAIIV